MVKKILAKSAATRVKLELSNSIPPPLLNQHGGKSRVLSALQTPGFSDLRGQSSAQGCLEEPARKPHTYQSSNGFSAATVKWTMMLAVGKGSR